MRAGEAPSTITIEGFLLPHPGGDPNGVYSIAASTHGGKPYWVKAGPPPAPIRVCVCNVSVELLCGNVSVDTPLYHRPPQS